MFTAEYSLKQKCFHVSDLEKTLKTNMGTIIAGKNCDYLIFYISKTHEGASKACQDLRKALENE